MKIKAMIEEQLDNLYKIVRQKYLLKNINLAQIQVTVA